MIPTAALILVLCFAMTGCFYSANQPAPAPNETAAPHVTTEPAAPTPAPGGAAAPAQAYDWRGKASAVEARINMFSEIQESHIVILGQTALVGVRFTGTYKGQLTQRIRDMVAGEVMAADTYITTVAVTAESADVAAIAQLRQRQAAGASDDELKPEFDKIVRDTNTIS